MNKKINIFCDDVDQATLEQFNSAIEQPDVVAASLMPDAHAGYSLPIGSVVMTKSTIYPSWVGYDIGCGVCAVPIDVEKEYVVKNADDIFQRIYEKVPVGFKCNAEPLRGLMDNEEFTLSFASVLYCCVIIFL